MRSLPGRGGSRGRAEGDPMGRPILRAALAALLLAIPGAQAGAVTWTFTPVVVPGTSRCPADVLPGELGSVIDLLGDTALDTTACSDPRACEQAARGLGQAFGAVCAGQGSRALSSAARAVR